MNQRQTLAQSWGRHSNYQVAGRQVMANTLLLALFVGCMPTESIGQEAQQASQLLRKANTLLAAEKYDDAAKLASEAAGLASDEFMIQQLSAEVLYRSGQSQKSLAPFDRAIKLAPDQAPRNWQRGLALATCGKFEEGAKQFETHHRVNPDDVENSAWYFLCIAKSKGVKAAREALIPSRGDPREPMMSILKMLKGDIQPDAVMQAAIDNTPEGSRRTTAQLYADLYIGLYYDSLGDKANADKYLKRSMTYGSTGYMADTARVYYAERFQGNEKAKRTAEK